MDVVLYLNLIVLFLIEVNMMLCEAKLYRRKGGHD